jgi:hypothetical protein
MLYRSDQGAPRVGGFVNQEQATDRRDPERNFVKIFALMVDTDLGRRTVQLSPPVDVEPFGDMPPKFRSLTEMYWKTICEIAAQGPALAAAAPKAEA